MAEAAALTSIAKSALQLFSSLATDEVLLLWHSGANLERLKDTIETIGHFLQDAQERESNDHSVHLCLTKLRKVMYDADDFFDALAFHLLRNKTETGNSFTKEVRLFFSKSNQMSFIVKTAHKVKSLRESLDAIAKNMQQFSFMPHQLPSVVQSFTRKKTHSFVNQEDIIGRDEDKARIISMLIPPNGGETSCHRSVSVVAVVGFGGLGKTALAQFVFNDERVKQGFDVHLWACINYLSNLEQVLKEITASKVEKNQLDLSVQMLQEKLRGIIGGKKFLLVLDENSENWLDLETILRCGKSGSKVLVTTRSNKVAKCLHALEPYCDLRGLSDKSAWSLLVKRTFQGEDPSEHPELEPIGKKILNKCGNVPLAIVIVGSLLQQKDRDERTWTKFYDNELKEVLSGGGDNGIKQVLMVSYKDLHPNLKLCFAYCSLFPKDYKFDKDDLVRLWLAQGIIKPSSDKEQSLEEVGETYFFHLVDRCFFQEVKYEHAGKHEYVGNEEYKCTAKMHDLLHDMALTIAKTENLLLDKVPQNKGETDGLRHISIAFDLEDSFDHRNLVSDPKTVRTLILFECKEQFSKASFSPFLKTFTMIRTLDLSYLGVDEVPESIGRLIHLRYLELSGNRKLKHIPNSICKLHHLMFLLLEGCKLLEKLPQRIEKLVSMRQLHINGCDSLDSLPPGLKALSSLVNLDRLIVHPRDGGLRFLEGLDNLASVLRIELPEEGWLDATEDAKKATMARKNKLNEMVIEWKRRSASPSGQRMSKDEAQLVLEALRPLEHLKIVNYGGEMLTSWVWTLRYIKQLYLCGCDQVEYLDDGIEGSLCFPLLKLLSISSLRNLKGWWRHQTAQGTNRPHLSTVSTVDIMDCPKLKGQMPLFKGIEYLSLWGVNAEVVTELLLPNCSSFYSNSKLMELQLSEIEGLISLQERWIKHLTALQRLAISDCRDLKWVSCHGLAHLTALKSLALLCGEIGEEDDEEDYKMGSEAGMPWKALQALKDLTLGFGHRTFQLSKYGIQYLHSLQHLTLMQCAELYLSWSTLLVNLKLVELFFIYVKSVIDVEEDKMMVVEVEPQHIQLTKLVICGRAGAKWVDDIPWVSLSSSLTFLSVWNTEEREQLPEGIQHLTSLQYLDILECEKLRALPVWIPKLTSLISLEISGCSAELETRCGSETGEDWALICNLPRMEIRKSVIEEDLRRSSLDNPGSKNEDKEKGIRKMGWCGHLSFSNFKRRFN